MKLKAIPVYRNPLIAEQISRRLFRYACCLIRIKLVIAKMGDSEMRLRLTLLATAMLSGCGGTETGTSNNSTAALSPPGAAVPNQSPATPSSGSLPESNPVDALLTQRDAGTIIYKTLYMACRPQEVYVNASLTGFAEAKAAVEREIENNSKVIKGNVPGEWFMPDGEIVRVRRAQGISEYMYVNGCFSKADVSVLDRTVDPQNPKRVKVVYSVNWSLNDTGKILASVSPRPNNWSANLATPQPITSTIMFNRLDVGGWNLTDPLASAF